MTLHAQDHDCNTSPPERLLVDELELAALFHVSRPTVRRWVSDGLIAPVALPHHCKRRLYRRADAERWVAELAAQP